MAQKDLIQLILSHTSHNGFFQTDIPPLTFIRTDSTTHALPTIYEPALIFIVQGSKIVRYGDRSHHYAYGTYLVNSVHMPVEGQIQKASKKEPYLCLQLRFNLDDLYSLFSPEQLHTSRSYNPETGLSFCTSTPAIENALLRLVHLLDEPDHIPVLAPLLTKEILYHLIQNDTEGMLQNFALLGSHANTLASTIQYIREHYNENLDMELLAERHLMSSSSFYAHFKRVTSLSPLQYQKKVRLIQARRMLLSRQFNVTQTAMEVGYVSPSQFSREYHRMFGTSPKKDSLQASDALFAIGSYPQ